MRLLGLVALLVLSACVVDLRVPEGSRVRCERDSDCQEPALCDRRIGECVTVTGNLPPTLSAAVPARALQNVPISLLALDANAPPYGDDAVTVSVAYRLAGGDWCPITALQDQPVNSDGSDTLLHWRPDLDACTPFPTRLAEGGSSPHETLRWHDGLFLQLTARDREGAVGNALSVGPFAFGNDAPTLQALFDEAEVSGDVILAFAISDSALDPAALEVELREPGALGFTPARLKLGATEGLLSDGSAYVTVWESTAPAGEGGVGARNVSAVELRLRAGDAPVGGLIDAGEWTTFIVDVHNQSPPSVAGARVDTKTSAATGALTVRYSLLDAQSDVADVHLSFRLDSDPVWRSVSEYPDPLSEGLFDLATAPAPGVEHVFRWDTIADLFVATPNVVHLRFVAADTPGGVGPELELVVPQPLGVDLDVQGSPGFVRVQQVTPTLRGPVELERMSSDGLYDLITGADDLELRLGLGSGSFGSGTFGSAATYNPTAVLVRPQLAVANAFDNTSPDLALRRGVELRLYAGAASGALSVHAPSITLSQPQGGLAFGDFDGDGVVDVAAGVGSAVVVYDGANAFLSPPTSLDLPSTNVELRTDDFDGDGKADLVAICGAGTGAATVALLYGRARVMGADPFFAAPITLADDLRVAFDSDAIEGDKYSGVSAATLRVGAAAYIAVGSFGSGTFGQLDLWSIDSGRVALRRASATVNGELRRVRLGAQGSALELAVLAERASGQAELKSYALEDEALVQHTRGLFSGPTCLGRSVDFAWRDLDSDSRSDAVVAWRCSAVAGALEVWMQVPEGALSTGLFADFDAVDAFSGNGSFLLSDIDHNGLSDLSWIEPEGELVASFLSAGSFLRAAGGLSLSEVAPIPTAVLLPYRLSALGDVSGDGIVDGVISSDGTTVRVRPGEDDGGFSALVTSARTLNAFHWVRDLNGDGFGDLIGSTTTNLNVCLAEVTDGSWQERFLPATTTALSTTVAGAASGDFDGDGVLDLATHSGSTLTVLHGLGTGAFTTLCTRTLSGTIAALATADIDDNGCGDVVAAVNSSGDTELEAVFGTGAGCSVVTSVSPAAASGAPSFIALHDLSGDGIQDVAVIAGGAVYIASGTAAGRKANGRFSSPLNAGLSATQVAFADLDNDGLEDLVAAQPTAGRIVVASGQRLSTESRWATPLLRALPTPPTVDRFGAPKTADIAWRPVGEDSSFSVRRSGLALAHDVAYRPLTRAMRAAGDEALVMRPDGRVSVVARAGPGIVVSLPVFDALASISLDDVVVFARDDTFVRDPSDVTLLQAGRFQRAATWRVITRDGDADLSNNMDERFVVATDGVRPIVHVRTERLGTFQAYYK